MGIFKCHQTNSNPIKSLWSTLVWLSPHTKDCLWKYKYHAAIEIVDNSEIYLVKLFSSSINIKPAMVPNLQAMHKGKIQPNIHPNVWCSGPLQMLRAKTREIKVGCAVALSPKRPKPRRYNEHPDILSSCLSARTRNIQCFELELSFAFENKKLNGNLGMLMITRLWSFLRQPDRNLFGKKDCNFDCMAETRRPLMGRFGVDAIY